MKIILLLLLFHLSIFGVNAQLAVTSVYTDFSGFWTSSTGSINPVSPNNTHHLLGFQTGSTVWTTGVNDATLTANGVTYSPQNFIAMPATVSGAGGLIGVGSQFNGAGCVPAPFGNNASQYLGDGIQGLNLSTAMFNVGGVISYTVSSIADFSINDGIPDIIITQVGDYTAGVNDWFRFYDADNNVIGTPLEVNFATIPKVSNLSWKFFTRAAVPACGGSTSGNRDFRMIAIDFADLGINAANYSSITRFEHQLSSRSDIAFVGYNTSSIDILPVDLISFDAVLKNRQVELIWHTLTETNNATFIVERSQDGQYWTKVLSKEGMGNSTALKTYHEIDSNPLLGTSYYRLSQIDFDGKQTYFNPVSVNLNPEKLRIYPNPTENILTIEGIEEASTFSFINTLGQNVVDQLEFVHVSENYIQLNTIPLSTGMYFVMIDGKSYPVVVN